MTWQKQCDRHWRFMAATLTELFDECRSNIDPVYAAKYLHAVPPAPVVQREEYIEQQCTGKRVLSLGGSGQLEKRLLKVASALSSVDKVRQDDRTVVADLDIEPEKVGEFAGSVDVVLCGEVLEHLSNPGRLLDAVRKLAVPLIVTVPNAFSSTGMQWMYKAKENVNKEHVAWYSYQTLRTLLERHGYELAEFFWYKGKPLVAEGLIVLAR